MVGIVLEISSKEAEKQKYSRVKREIGSLRLLLYLASSTRWGRTEVQFGLILMIYFANSVSKV